MTTTLKVAMALFYLPLAGLYLLHFYRHGDFSALFVGRWLGFCLVSVVMPLWWTITLTRELGARGVHLNEYRVAMPAWCAGATAAIAMTLW